MTTSYLYAGNPTGVGESAGPYTLGVEFVVSTDAWLTGIGVWRPNTGHNPTVGAVWDVATGAKVAGSDVAYALSGTGWQTARPTAPPKLTAGRRYVAGVLFPDKFVSTPGYFTTGDGKDGITRAFLTAPSRANATGQKQNRYAAGDTLTFPNVGNSSGPSYWVDVLVTDVDPAASQPGPDQPLFAFDVSRWQPGFPMAAAKAEGMAFVIAKIGQGASADGTRGSVDDPEWINHRTAARAAGIPLGGYWYIGDAEAPARQASRCAALIGDPSIVVALDWEEGGGEWPNVVACVDAFRAAGLNVRILYARKTWYDAHGGTATGIADLGLVLWNARYPSNNGGTPAQLYQAGVAPARASYWQTYGGATTRILQYSDDSTIAGVTPVDANAFHGTAEDVAALFTVGGSGENPDQGGGEPPYPGGGGVPDPGNPSPQPEPEPDPEDPDVTRVRQDPPPLGPLAPVGGYGWPSGALPEPIDVTYRVHFQDLRTGTPQGSLPMIGTKYSVVLGGDAGALSGLINVSDPAVRALNPWGVAIPRRTAVFLQRIEHYPPGTIPDRDTVDWGGILWDLDPLAGKGHLQVKAATPESYFKKRQLTADLRYDDWEQTALHADLLRWLQAVPGGNIRVEAEPIPTGRLRDREYLGKDRKTASEAMAQLSAVLDGFDWYIGAYRDRVTGRFGFRVRYGYPRLGRQAGGSRGALQLRYLTSGGGNLIAPPTVKRQGSAVYNEVTGLGPTTDDKQLQVVVSAEELGRAEITAGYPLLQTTYSDTNESNPDVLRSHAAAELRRGWASEILLTKCSLQGTRRPTRAEIGLGDDTALYTDDATWPRPVTLTGRVWAIETACATGDTAEQVDLTLAGEGITV